jgi:hypothetical protein
MSQWWAAFKSSNQHFSALHQDCAWIVKQCLNEGISVFNPAWANFLNTHFVAWTPTDVQTFASDLKQWCDWKKKGLCDAAADYAWQEGVDVFQELGDFPYSVLKKGRSVVGY